MAAPSVTPSGCATCPPGTRPCGERARYVWGPGPGQDRTKGCRCEPCRAANRAYQLTRDRATRRPDEVLISPYVPAGPVRAHLAALAEAGVGSWTIAALASLRRQTVVRILRGEQRRILRSTRERLLAISPDQFAGGMRIPAGPTWALVDRLRAAGWTKARISAEIGQGGRALQLGRDYVTARNARAIANLADHVFGDVHLDGTRHPYLLLAEILEDRRAPWRARAVCRPAGIPVDLFFVGRGESAAPAKAICRRCPVKVECDAYAAEHHMDVGIWAERAPKERRPGRPDEEEVA